MEFRRVAAVWAAGLVLGAGPGVAAQFEGVVATVADEVRVTAADVRDELRETSVKHQVMTLSPREAAEVGLERALRRALVLLDVKRRNLLDGDLGDRFWSAEVRALAPIYRWARLEEIEVSDAEVDREEATGRLERRQVSYIVSTSRDELQSVLKRARAGEDFAALARQYSEGPASEKGGDLGWLELAENKYFSEEQWAAISSLPEGGITELFPSSLFEDSWAIAKVFGIKPYAADEVASIREARRAAVKARKFDAEIARLVAESGLTLQRELLGTLASLDRRVPVATFKGGAVSAGVFRRHLERGGVALAGADPKVIEGYLRSFAETAIVAAEARTSPAIARHPETAFGVKKGSEDLILSLYFDDIYAPLKVAEAEVERYFREYPEENTIPEQVDLYQIHVASEGEAKEALARLKKGEDLEALAVLFAWSDAERRQAGHVGLTKRSSMAKPMADAVFSLGLMQPSKPIATRFGYYIFQVRQKFPAKSLTLEQRAPVIRAALLEKKKAKAFQEALDGLRATYPVKVDHAALDKL